MDVAKLLETLPANVAQNAVLVAREACAREAESWGNGTQDVLAREYRKGLRDNVIQMRTAIVAATLAERLYIERTKPRPLEELLAEEGLIG